jgi:predicted nucleic acid-binding protein
VKWFFTDEPLRWQALRVLQHLASHPHEFIVPHLFLSEMIHVLARESPGRRAF